MIWPFKIINAAIKIFDSSLNTKFLSVLIKAIYNNLTIITTCTEQIRISHICWTQNPTTLFVKSFKTINRFLFIHYPQIYSVIWGGCVKKLICEYMYAVDCMLKTIIQ